MSSRTVTSNPPSQPPDATPPSYAPDASQSQVVNLGGGQVLYNGQRMSVFAAATAMFIDRAGIYSDLTADKLAKAKENLEKIKTARNYLQQLRKTKNYVKDHGGTAIPTGDSKYTDDMKAFLKENNIVDGSGDNQYNGAELDTTISNIQSALDNMSETNQVEMLGLKTSINNLDTSVTGASKNEDKLHSTEKDVISGLAR